ncbi:MAG TPA: DNA/RNA nuclease SfsA [Polyangiaceae bacterium LLY-WYZ-15_(1-7)]|nr:DNA/RNA nuclease SfsA [Polyangiaceae bacterium LLY-WYZ-15_(1-7)]HJL00883.1 DNA/RNA nuclease SfsA [Polyangiaceae bacterium LLY-WYZ-15_(1-7)]HJL11071.1 DNA/RNA nuclease SfsA [Polyangiaceae bacterium LLY-WYZ-15_(1-7)]HJL34666.1 DNA/RNA nuclease SfsA [Polyangiaceae bacterium LLY-WYZ-15_(1-7)]
MLLRIPHVELTGPLQTGRLVGRYDRFIAEVALDDGPRVRAHCVNPGRMEGLVRPGAKVWLSAVPPESPRKLRYTWELMEDGGRVVGTNTVVPNAIVGRLLAARVLPGLKRFAALRSEVRYGERSRADFLLEGKTPHFVEVKNCHLVYPDGRGYFPDSVSERAAHHLEALSAEVRAGAKATVLFTVQRDDVVAVRPSELHDPRFAEAARAAKAAGVRFRAVRIRVTPEAYEVLDAIPVELRRVDVARLRPWREERLRWSGWVRDPAKRAADAAKRAGKAGAKRAAAKKKAAAKKRAATKRAAAKKE